MLQIWLNFCVFKEKMAFANMISRSLIHSVQKSMTDILDKEIFAEEAKTANVEVNYEHF